MDVVPSIVCAVLTTAWILFLQPVIVFGANIELTSLRNDLFLIVALVATILVSLFGLSNGLNEASYDKITLLEHFQDGLIIVDTTRQKVKFVCDSAKRLFPNSDTTKDFLSKLTFYPQSVTRDTLLERC